LDHLESLRRWVFERRSEGASRDTVFVRRTIETQVELPATLFLLVAKRRSESGWVRL
jgi:hypothetical protein